MAVSWVERVASFLRSPSRFLASTTAEVFLVELLREQRDERVTYDVKLTMLSPLCEHPTLLCPSACTGEETCLELMSVFSHCPPKYTEFRCQLLLTLTTVLVSTGCVSAHSHASRDFLELLLKLAQDTYYDPADVPSALRSTRAAACECLRELEACCPSLLSQHLELLNGLRQQENPRHHQALSGLYAVVLRNGVHLLARQAGAGPEGLKALLGGNAAVAWEAEPDSPALTDRAAPLPSVLGPSGLGPTLQTGPDCKELRSVLSSLLEESYLLTPLSQAALLHALTEVVAMVSGVSPAIFKAQLLRLLGTSKVCLFHCTLLMKAAFTDSLFSAEDEAFLLKRLVALCQHPQMSTAAQLFYTDCLVHFPENRPIGAADGGEALPVLLTPRLAASLVPTVFDEPATMLARLNVSALVHLEEHGAREGGAAGGGLAYLWEHLLLRLHVVEHGGDRAAVVTFFRASFLFLCHFGHVERHAADLRRRLCALYLRHCRLAPHVLNLADRAQDGPVRPGWAVALLRSLQGVAVSAGGDLAAVSQKDLHWHLRVLARVAEEGQIGQGSTVDFLFAVATAASPPSRNEDWRLGSDLLAVCRHLLAHPGLDALLCPLADVLQHVARHHGDTDVRDHARLYYSLLTALSREKLAGVLANGGGGANGGRQDNKRVLSAMVVESQDLTSALTIHKARTPVFHLVAKDRAGGWAEPTPAPEDDEAAAAGTEPGAPDADVLSSYRSQLLSSGAAAEIALSYELRHLDVGPAGFDRLFSLRLHFEPSAGRFAALADVCVPRLFREGASAAPPAVTLTLRPRAPYPGTLRCSAVFTAQDELTWHAALPDVHVAFRQLFKPLPVPASWGPALRLRAFERLWDEFCSDGDGGSVGEGGGGDASPDRACSLFCGRLGEAELEALLEEHFAPFRVADPGDATGHRVLLFIPPGSHVLLRIRPQEDAVQFHMATDNWRLLPHVNDFLLSVTDWEARNGVDS
ncbi:AP-5 complex subunit beta-1 [Gadus morhua]|uniref:AP-5 complex subunit beta-1 n=1 Tax=Gadus morhua TaxID=8049 RepID=UPI0011B5BC04|nr:AP-5 complex subunit beta-1 [Gadus morhua]